MPQDRPLLLAPERTPTIALFALVLGLLVALLEIGAIAFAFERIGIASSHLVTLLAVSLLGSNLNLPLTRAAEDGHPALAANVGGALLPAGLSGYLLATGAAPPLTALGVAAVALVVHRLARPVPGVGIAVPIFVPPLAAAAAGLVLAPASAPAAAYVAGTLGTLIGADLSNLGRLRALGGTVAAIGGAGTFDGIFVTGVLAVLLA